MFLGWGDRLENFSGHIIWKIFEIYSTANTMNYLNGHEIKGDGWVEYY
ncbi:MAG: hypothetical protein F6K25_05700 [Okeania sp. SIO2G4]|nr:hypothetical protein [Okeania sp. SIO2G4]NEQ90241.1 hypothetical protein [Okeania sp. SIO2G4]